VSSRGDGRWSVIVAYALVAAAVQMLWLSYAAITTTTARRYGVSVATVGWLSEIFPLLYVVLAIPAGALLDRHFRAVLGGGGGLLALGAVVRLGGTTFAWAMSGQVLIAVAQPIVLSAVTRLAGEYLDPSDRANGIALGSAGSLVGMLVALVLGPLVGDHGHLERLLAVEAALAVAAAAGLALALRAPGHASTARAALAGGAARSVWRVPEIRILCTLVFLGFGIFVAIATWLQTLLHPAGVSDTTAGAVLVGIVIAGVLGCGALAPRVSERRGERQYMLTTVMVTVLGCLLCAVTTSLGVRTVALLAFGALLLSALPIVLTKCERLAGPLAGSAGAIVWLAGNLGGLAVAVIVQALVHHPMLAFAAMAAVAGLGLPLALKLPSAMPTRDRAAAL
jgi:predicted MFS family arabinose efflux permease